MKLKTNLISGIFAGMLGTVLLILNPSQIQEELFVTPGQIRADFIPKITSYAMILLGIILVIQSIIFHKEQIVEIERTAFSRSLIFLGMLVLYSILFVKFGFLIPSVLFSVGLLLFIKCKKTLYFFICTIFPVFIYFVFNFALAIKLPLL